jgi:hypothetical protein
VTESILFALGRDFDTFLTQKYKICYTKAENKEKPI